MSDEQNTQQLIDAGLIDAPETPTAVVETPETGQDEPAQDTATEPADEPLGEAGLRALRSERDARAKAEGELKSLAGVKGQLTKATNSLASVQKERDDLASELARYRVAVTHGLSAEDIDLLPAGVEDEVLERLAVRLSNPGVRRPAPDANQGRDGGAAADDPKAAFAALLASLD